MKKALIILSVAVKTCQPCPAGITANTLFEECRGESEAGQRAVASVIYNRAANQGKTLKAVCLSPKQFSCWNKGYTKARPRLGKEKEILSRFEAWEAQMEDGTFKTSGKWTHYYNPRLAAPSWAKSLKNKSTVGNHVFGITK